MQNETTYSGILGEWQRLQAALSANMVDLTHLDGSRLIFADLLDQAQAIIRRQAAQAAEKQQSSQDLRAKISDGQRMATMLRQGIKQYYGIRSEKLDEFGLAARG
jgi:transcriptional regulatory protein LevR